MQKNPDIVLVSNELGYGVVPIDAFDRNYRETTGLFYGNCDLTADNGKDLSLRSIVFLFFVLYVCKF